MTLNLRSIAVGAALVIVLAGLGWFAGSNGDARPPSLDGRPGAAAPRGVGRPGPGGPNGPVSVLVASVRKEAFATELEAVGSAHANEALSLIHI